MNDQSTIRDHHIEEELEIKNLSEEIVYTDDGAPYKQTERVFENDALKIRLYCMHKGCKKYVIGIEHYNGGFVSEAGTQVDLRNQGFICSAHSEKHDKSLKKIKHI